MKKSESSSEVLRDIIDQFCIRYENKYEKRLKYKDIAEQLGIKPETLSQWLTRSDDKRRRPSITAIGHLRQALQMSDGDYDRLMLARFEELEQTTELDYLVTWLVTKYLGPDISVARLFNVYRELTSTQDAEFPRGFYDCEETLKLWEDSLRRILHRSQILHFEEDEADRMQESLEENRSQNGMMGFESKDIKETRLRLFLKARSDRITRKLPREIFDPTTDENGVPPEIQQLRKVGKNWANLRKSA